MRSSWVVCLVALLVLPVAPVFAEDEPISTVHRVIVKLPSAAASRFAEPIATAAADPETKARPAALVPLYASLAAFNALDVHSTLTGLSDGTTREANPLMKPFVTSHASFILLKASTTGAAILLTEKMRKKHPKRAVVVMILANAAMAAIVANNYRAHRP